MRAYGAASFTRASPRTVNDHEGKTRNLLLGEVGFTGARRVRNTLTSSEDNAVLNGGPSSNATTAGTSVTFTAASAFNYKRSTVTPINGGVYVARVKLSSANKAVVGFRVVTNGSAGSQQRSVALTAIPTVYSLLVSATGATTSIDVGLDNRVAQGGDDTTTGTITATEWQLEDVTGQANQNPGEYVSVGAAKLNELLQTEALTTAPWTLSNAGFTGGQTAPNGTATAWKLTETAAAAGHYTQQTGISRVVGAQYRSIVYMKAAEASFGVLQLDDTASPFCRVWFNLSTGVVGTNVVGGTGQITLASASMVDAGGGWWRCEAIFNTGSAAATTNFIIATGRADGTFGYVGTVGEGILVWGTQFQQAALSSGYFPVGNVYPYHGSCVDGVKCFGYHNGNTVSGNVVTEAVGREIGQYKNQSAWTPGLAGSYFSTPDSVALSITGDIDIRWYGVMADWTPAVEASLVNKYVAGGNQISYAFDIATGGQPRLYTSPDGSTIRTNTASTGTGFADGTAHWVRATKSRATGDVKFWTSEDGLTWTQLGTTIAGTVEDTFDSTAFVVVGALSGSSLPLLGTTYRAQIYNGIDGTLVADFNPQDWTSGATWTAPTGEVWTRNGGATINNFPLLGYLQEQQVTNLCLQSEDFATTWTVSSANVAVSTNQTPAPDGASTADKLYEATVVNSTHDVAQTFAKAASALPYVFSVYIKAAERSAFLIEISDNAGNGCFARGDTANGSTITAPTTYGAGFTAGIFTLAPSSSGWWRATITATTTAVATLAVRVRLYNGADTYVGVVNSGLYLWGAQLEQSTYVAASYIPTATGTATKNQDVLTYPRAGNLTDTAGTASAEVFQAVQGTQSAILSMSTSPDILYRHNSGQLSMFDGTNSHSSSSTIPVGSVVKVASRWSTSEASMRSAMNGVLSSAGAAAYDGDFGVDSPTIGIGSGGNWNGNIRHLRTWTITVPEAVLLSIT